MIPSHGNEAEQPVLLQNNIIHHCTPYISINNIKQGRATNFTKGLHEKLFWSSKPELKTAQY